jgi:hypothetical protein
MDTFLYLKDLEKKTQGIPVAQEKLTTTYAVHSEIESST